MNSLSQFLTSCRFGELLKLLIIVEIEAIGKTYDHKTYNCATFSAWLVDLLV